MTLIDLADTSKPMTIDLLTLISASLWLHLSVLSFCCLAPLVDAINPACECVLMKSPSSLTGQRTSSATGPRTHLTLMSPNFPRPYSQGINCILYTIIADKSQLIELTFVEFDMAPPIKNRCVDYVRLYLDLNTPAINERDPWNYELCGNVSMLSTRQLYSSTSTMILELHSDLRPTAAFPTPAQRHRGSSTASGHVGFRANYRFVEKSDYETVGGSRRWGQAGRCAYDFYSGKSNNSAPMTAFTGGTSTSGGRFFSPRYPQNYPPSTSCHYTFYGQRDERVWITFDSVQLEHFDGSCTNSPDHITVRDGEAATSRLVARICNSAIGRRVTSFGQTLFVEFVSDARNQRQGFAASYAFVSDTQDHHHQQQQQQQQQQHGDSQAISTAARSHFSTLKDNGEVVLITSEGLMTSTSPSNIEDHRSFVSADRDGQHRWNSSGNDTS